MNRTSEFEAGSYREIGLGKKGKGRKSSATGAPSSGGSKKNSNMIIVVVAALAVGLFFGGVFMPALKDSSTPQVAGGAGSASSFAQQIEETKKLLESQPESVNLWTKLGNLYFDTDQYANAIDAYSKSLAIEPDNAHVLTDLGVMYRRNGNPQKAVENFDKAILAAPTHETARLNKGIVLYYDLKDKAGAIQAWNGLVQMNPGARTPNGKLVKDMIRDLS